MRFHYVFSEIMTGLRRNLTMTLAVVITVAISLGFLGTGLLVRAQVEHHEGLLVRQGRDLGLPVQRHSTRGSGCARWPGHRRQQQAQIEQTLDVTSARSARSSPSPRNRRTSASKSSSRTRIAETITPDQLQESFRVELRRPRAVRGRRLGSRGTTRCPPGHRPAGGPRTVLRRAQQPASRSAR